MLALLCSFSSVLMLGRKVAAVVVLTWLLRSKSCAVGLTL